MMLEGWARGWGPWLATAMMAPDAHLARMQRFVIELAVILIVARLAALLAERRLRIPAVIGELLSGVILGPFALGRLPIPGWGPLFPMEAGAGIPVTPELYALATLASLLLLFSSGLETDVGMFLRYFSAGATIGLGGVVFSFLVGSGFACLAGLAPCWLSPSALFLGAVTTATSVGITARILSEQQKTDSPEGVTILAAAVFDDVIGIVVLALVLAVTRAGQAGAVDWRQVGWLAAKTFGIWLGCMAFGLLSARRLSRGLKQVRSAHALASFSLGLALLVSGLMESAGLAMILGAYIMGLSLSRTDVALEIRHYLHPAQELLLPVFFVVMGMLVDLTALRTVWRAGLVFSALAALAKVLGCGLPALGFRFTPLGALRIGLGMMPRGEVALIVAAVGLSLGGVGPEIIGLSALMTVLTTMAAPPLLVRSFAGGPGLRGETPKAEERHETVLDLGHPDLADLLLRRVEAAFRREDFFVTEVSEEPPVYQIRKDDMVFTMRLEGSRLILSAPSRYIDVGRFVILEELLELRSLAESLRDVERPRALGNSLVESMFRPS